MTAPARTATRSARRELPRRQLTPRRTVLLLTISLALVAALALADLCIGTPTLSPQDALGLLVDGGDSPTAIVVRTLRLPRVLLAIAAGAALAVAGVLMQALTRNPLADPGILGVNAGAAFAVAFAFVVLGLRDFGATLGFAFLGAAAASILVWGLGRGGFASMSRLVVAGVAVAAVLAGFTQALALLNASDYALIRVWEAGSLSARDAGIATSALAVVAAVALAAMFLGPALNLISLGEDQAHALGARVARVRTLGLLAIVALAATATAAVGPIGFVGLLVPHALRAVVGADQIRLLWCSLLGGPMLLLGSDLLARTVIAPAELPIGVVTAIVGAPLLIVLVQRRRRAE